MSQPDGDIATRLRWFAEKVFGGRSPLYERLSLAMADDDKLWDLLALIPSGQPAPNMLFGAVHALLLSGTRHPLAEYYPSLGGPKPLSATTYPIFVNFCRQHADAIRQMITTRTLQTNEVGRSALWLPALCHVAAEVGDPLHLIELGPSAGLNLYWDRYGYDYGHGVTAGDRRSPVQLSCDSRGDGPLPIRTPLPRVAGRVGIDLHPIDVRDPQQVLWLRALLWPEQSRRTVTLMMAVALVQHDPPVMRQGDLFDHLSAAVSEAPGGTTVVVMHSFMANQLSEEERTRLDALCARIGRTRPIHRLAIEWLGGPHPTITWTQYGIYGPQPALLAEADQHGQWIRWAVGDQGAGQ